MNSPFSMIPATPAPKRTPFEGTPQEYMGAGQSRAASGGGGDPFTTFVGTTAESAIDMLTFGIWQPDIIPEAQEQANPTATMLGRVAGNIAGFLPAMSVSGVAAGRALSLFGWGRNVKAGLSLTKGAIATHGLFQTGSQFAIHDVAREFVRQIKENDPDAYAIGDAALTGFIGGGIFGFIGGYAAHTYPAQRLIYNGGAMAAADAVNMAAQGDNPLDYPEELAQSFLMGMAMAAPTLVNWRGKRVHRDEAIIENAQAIRKMFADPKSDAGKIIQKVTKDMGVIDEPQVQQMLKVLKVMGGSPETGKKLVEVARINPDSWKWGGDMNAPVKAGHRGMLKKIHKQLGISDDDFHGMVSTVTKGRVKSSNDLTAGEAKAVLTDLVNYSQQYVDKVSDAGQLAATIRKQVGLGDVPVTEYTGLAGVLKFKPIDTVLRKLGMIDFLDDVRRSKRYMATELHHLGNEVKAAIDMFEVASKTTGRAVSKSAVGNRPTEAMALLERALEMNKGAELQALLKTFNPAQKEAFRSIRKVTNFYFERTNEARKFLGLDPIQYREGYLAKVYKGQVAEEVGLTYETIQAQRKGAPTRAIKEPENVRAIARKEGAVGEEVFTGRDRLYRRVMNMAHHDAKEIYLHQPVRVVKATVNQLLDAGVMTPAEAKFAVEYTQNFALNQPSESWRKLDASLKGFLSAKRLNAGSIEGAINGMMETFRLNYSITDRPATDAIRVFGAGVSRGMIAGRPSLAFRNMFQSFLPHQFVSTKAMAKAMFYDTPEGLQKRLDADDIWQFSQTMAEEGVGGKGAMGLVHAKFNVKNSANAAYWEMADNIIMDSAGKRGYSTSAGRALRAKSKNKHVFAEDEWSSRIMPEVRHMISGTQWMYDSMGLPGTFATPGGKVMFKLQSWPMNYVFNYLDEGIHRAKTGYRSWDTAKQMKLTAVERAGILKHFAGMALVVNAFAQLGMDYSSTAGITPTYTEEEGFRVRVGAFNFRPSPGMALITGLQKMWSDDEVERTQGRREVKWILGPATIPSYLAGRELKRAIDTGDRSGLLFKMERKRGRRPKQKAVHGVSSPFKSPFTTGRGSPFGQPFAPLGED